MYLGRIHAVAAAKLAAICALVVVLVSLSVQSASAACPTAAVRVSGTTLVDRWAQEWPPSPTFPDDRGVFQCKGYFGDLNPVVDVMIIDFNEGARVRLKSSVYSYHPTDPAYTQFVKKTARTWYSFLGGRTTPGANELFGVVNAGFFTNTTNGVPTYLSMPERVALNYESDGVAIHGSDPASRAPKRALTLTNSVPQTAAIKSFPTTYTFSDILSKLGSYDGVVGFEPLHDMTGSSSTVSRRTIVGTNNYLSTSASKLYIVSTQQFMTLAQAQGIAKFLGSTTEIQLDGGGSAQVYSSYGNMDSYIPGWPVGDGPREVPEVLAVYLGN